MMIVLTAAALYLAISAWHARRWRALFTPTGLVVQGEYEFTAAYEDLLVDEAVHLDPASERMGFVARTRGTTAPGYQAGWFITGRQHIFAMITDRNRVVYVPVRSGDGLMLSVPNADGFLRALRDSAVRSR